jgi:hypothetical protein
LGSDIASADKVFDITTTVLGSEVTDENRSTYNLLKTKYKEVYELDESYNALVTSLQKQLQEQNRALEIQADIDYQTQGNIAAEMGASLGTGAQAIQASELSQARQETSDEISQTINEYAAEYSEQLSSSYESAIESVLGKKNDDGTYANIVEYQEMADSMMTGLVRTIAATILGNDSLSKTDDDGNTVTVDPYQLLADNGLLTTTSTGDYELTDAGYAVIDQILNGYQPFGVGSGLSDEYDTTDSAIYKIADQAGREKYGSAWDTMDSDKKDSIRKDYMDWLSDNGLYFRATNAGLFDYDDDGNVVVDEEWSFESYDTSDAGITTNIFDVDIREKFGDSIIESVSDGKLTNGSYVVSTDGSYYQYSNGVFYPTDYTFESGIPTDGITTDILMSVVLENNIPSDSDKYFQAIIDAANDGKIADGTYIMLNTKTNKDAFGEVTSGYAIQYKDGKFIYVGMGSIGYGTKIEYSYTRNGTRISKSVKDNTYGWRFANLKNSDGSLTPIAQGSVITYDTANSFGIGWGK